MKRCLASAASARPAAAEVSDLFAVVPAIMEQSFWPLFRINVGHNSRPVLPLNREIGRKDFCPHHSTWQERGMNSVGFEIPCGEPSEHSISLTLPSFIKHFYGRKTWSCMKCRISYASIRLQPRLGVGGSAPALGKLLSCSPQRQATALLAWWKRCCKNIHASAEWRKAVGIRYIAITLAYRLPSIVWSHSEAAGRRNDGSERMFKMISRF